MSYQHDILNESHLWNSLKAGDTQAFAKIYDLHIKSLYNFGNKISQDSSLVEDAIHDLFVDIWRYRENLSPVISIRAYLYASLRRRIIRDHKNANILRYDHKWEELNLITLSEETKRIEKEASDEQLEKLKKHLNNLSPRQYEAIILRFYDELSYPEIALIMEVNEQSVRNFIQRGLDHLRQYSKIVVSILMFLLLIINN